MNAFKSARQRRKALAVARAIWARLDRADRTSSALPATVAAMPEGQRLGWALEAGVPPLSDESWALVVEELRIRVADERRWLSIEEVA